MMKPFNRRVAITGGIRHVAAILGVALGCVPCPAVAAPGDVLFYDNLNGNLNGWSITANGGEAAITNDTRQSGRSLRLRWGPVSVTSPVIDASVPAARFDVWVRRGDDSFSEDPDEGEDLAIEYLNATGSWVLLLTYGGDEDSPGDIYTPQIILPPDALHAALRIRFRQTGGDGDDWDYWHVDDPRIVEIAAADTFELGSCAGFESGLGDWSVTANGGSAGVSNATAATGNLSMFLRWEEVSVSSPAVDLAGASNVEVTAWVRRGSDSFSEDPDSGEDLVVEYLDDVGDWIILQTFDGAGTPGEIATPTYSLPTPALHPGFRLRFRQTGGDDEDWDYWHVDDVCLTGTSAPALQFSLDESAWNGTAGEVQDSAGLGVSGAAYGGANTANLLPAIAGNPGTCRYGDFDGIDDYVEIPDDPLLDLPDALTVGVWINARSLPGSELHTIVSKDWNYEFHLDSSGRIYWWWNNASGTARTLTSSTGVTVGLWHHVAITYESGEQVIYLDGNPVATSGHSESLRLNDLPLYIGTDYNFISRAFDGLIDEVTIHDQALSQAEIQAMMAATHPCASIAPLFRITHDGYGIHCQPETILVEVVDAVTGTPLPGLATTIVLDTQSGRGTWQLVNGQGSITDSVTDDGVATYEWQLVETAAVFSLDYAVGPAALDVDVFQQNNAGIRDDDAEGSLVFSPSGFSVTAAALANPPPSVIVPFTSPQTAGIGFPLHIAAYGTTPDDPQCGVIESYAGSKSLDIWMYYRNPGSGSRVAAVDSTPIGSNEATAVSVPVEFVNGQAAVTVDYRDVGEIRVALRDPSSTDPLLASGIAGATADFVVRPYDFQLTAIETATLPNPGAASAGGPVFVAAGDPFAVTVTARDATGAATPNFGQESIPESVALVPTLVAPAGGDLPAVSAAAGFGTFAGGSATGVDFSWPEVGIITLTPEIADGDYLGAGNVVGSASGNVGRFVPHHFAVDLNSPQFASACTAGGFTYIGEPFAYSARPEITFTAMARNGETADNYTGDFFRLSSADLPDPVYSASTGLLDASGATGVGATPEVSVLGPGRGSILVAGGSGLRFQRQDPVAEFNAEIVLQQTVSDADGVTSTPDPVVFGASGGIAFDAGASMRFGRLNVVNAYGPELFELTVPVVNEYFVSPTIGFMPNSNDSCTASVPVTLASHTENLAQGDTCVLDAGLPLLGPLLCAVMTLPGQVLSDPFVNGRLELRLAAPGDGNDGSLEVQLDAPSWLEFDWDSGSAGLEDPFGLARFGIFKGNGRIIHRTESY